MRKILITSSVASMLLLNVGTASALDFKAAKGDGQCPSGYVLATVADVKANEKQACAALGEWYIARLAGGGSMDGPGYNCKIRDHDDRKLGDSLCLRLEFKASKGDGQCPAGFTLATPQEARANQQQACAALGEWYIARLAGGGSMDGPGYNCKIRDLDTRGVGDSLCRAGSPAPIEFKASKGDGQCSDGLTLATPQEARANEKQACAALGEWYIARLAGGGSMDGPGYNCKIRDKDDRKLGDSLCKKYLN
jgi:opacity protein-like surface antigen